MPTLDELLRTMAERGATDLHLTTDTPPQIRVRGDMTPLDGEVLTPADTREIIYSALTEAQRHHFEEEHELDCSIEVTGVARFRVNVFLQRGAVAGVFRQIPFKIKTFQELNLPPVVQELSQKPRGLVLVTGPTGSGKSTTLASIVDRINTEWSAHIITIEDPIEYLHANKKCVVNQREVGADTKGFKTALKYVLRQDPDVVLVGEMRDLETIEAALTIAETGHLTLATLHTNSAAQTIHRIVDVFSPHQQAQVRAQLSMVLEGILSQQLLPKADGKGMVIALEILVPTTAIRNLIREDKVHQIYSAMQTGQSKYGMQTMNQSLADLYMRKLITREEAFGRSSLPDELQTMIQHGADPRRERAALR